MVTRVQKTKIESSISVKKIIKKNTTKTILSTFIDIWKIYNIVREFRIANGEQCQTEQEQQNIMIILAVSKCQEYLYTITN